MGRLLYVLTAAQRALLALRPGPMDTQQVQGCGLHEAVKDLIAQGYADHQRTGKDSSIGSHRRAGPFVPGAGSC